mgnify:CR=1 FL=1
MPDTEDDESRKLKRGGGTYRPPKRFAILRIKKISGAGGTGRANLSAAFAHNLRERNTPNADAGRLHDNTILKGPSTVTEAMAAWDARAPENVRRNAVPAVEFVVTASPEALASMSRTDQDEYFRRALDWIELRHGADNVLSAVVHRDETSPHLQVMVIPLDDRGRLNARELVGGKTTLNRMQTDFAQTVGLPCGLERGREKSGATHQSIREYYARASQPAETNFRLPERQCGGLPGRGSETDEEWRQRAQRAVDEHIRHLTVQLTERERNLSLTISAQAQDSIATMQDQVKTAEARATRAETRADHVAQLIATAIEANETGFAHAHDRDLSEIYNRLGPECSAPQVEALRAALGQAGVHVLDLRDGGTVAVPVADLAALARSGSSGGDRNMILTALKAQWEATERTATTPSPARELGRNHGDDFEL